jgi:hypothetical protein
MIAARGTLHSESSLIALHAETDTAFVCGYLLEPPGAPPPIDVGLSPSCRARLS